MKMGLFRKVKGILVIGLATAMLSTSVSAAEVDNSSFLDEPEIYKGRSVFCKDLITGEESFIPASEIEVHTDEDEGFSPGYNPYPSTNANDTISLLSVIDDRTLIKCPADDERCRNTVRISFTNEEGKPCIGSGFMIGPNAVATVGHNLFNNGKWSTDVVVTPAYTTAVSPQEPYGHADAIGLHCGGDWANSGAQDDDWGIIFLNWDIGNKVGWLGLRWQSETYNGTSVMVNGYPYHVRNILNFSMHMSEGHIDVTLPRRLISYDICTSEGTSGGPCYIDSKDTGFTAIGLTRGSGNQNGNDYISFQKIDKSLYEIFVQYRTSTLNGG